MRKIYFEDPSGDVIEFCRIDMKEELTTAAYDEYGLDVVCDMCDGTMRWNKKHRSWVCKECGREMNRSTFFDHIGAEPPGSRCESRCNKNYPRCKQNCPRYNIPEGDRML